MSGMSREDTRRLLARILVGIPFGKYVQVQDPLLLGEAATVRLDADKLAEELVRAGVTLSPALNPFVPLDPGEAER